MHCYINHPQSVWNTAKNHHLESLAINLNSKNSSNGLGSKSSLDWSRWFWGLVFCYQNCSDLLWGKNVLVIVYNFWNSKFKAENLQNFGDHLNNLLKQWKVRTISLKECFLTWSWRFPIPNRLEQLEFKLEKIIGI